MKYGTSAIHGPAVVNPQTDTTAATPSLQIFREHIQDLEIVPGQSQMLHVTS
jgi:hypothetical protein